MDRRDFLATVAATPLAVAGAAAEATAAQTAARVPRPLGVTLLGTGTPSPSLERQSSGYLIEVGTDVTCGNHRDNALIAKRAGAKSLVLVHLLAQIDQPGIREQIGHEIQQVYDGKVIWGEDLMKLDIAGSKISTIETRSGQ